MEQFTLDFDAPTYDPNDDKLLQRFRDKFIVKDCGYDTPCWVWQAATLPNGYSRFHPTGPFTGGNTMVYAHRYSYEIFRGAIPSGMQIDHLCRVRGCVNPAHMEVVTNKVNSLRSESFTAKNARKTHCPKGHEYSGSNLYVSSQGYRQCKTCREAYKKKLREEKQTCQLK